MARITWSSGLRETLEVVASLCTIGVAIAALTVVYRGGFTQGPGATSPQNRSRPQPPLPSEPLSLTGAQTKGSQTAKVSLIVFSDFQCPYCGKFARETLPTIEKEFVDTGKVLLAFRQLPLEKLHKDALGAARASECAGVQGQFWTAHDYFFQHQDRLAKEVIVRAADVLKVDGQTFEACVNASKASTQIQADLETAQQLQITGTPTFFVGTIGVDGKVKVSDRLSGAQPLDAFRAALQKLTS